MPAQMARLRPVFARELCRRILDDSDERRLLMPLICLLTTGVVPSHEGRFFSPPEVSRDNVAAYC